MSENYKLFVLKVFKHGESDLVVHALDSNGEKLHLFARAALKSKKRFGGGVLEPTHYITANIKKSRREDGMDSLQEADLINGFTKLREDYDRLQVALHMVQLVDQFCKEGLSDNQIVFHLLGNGLQAAEISSELETLRLHFDVKFLSSQGILPHINGADDFVSGALFEHEKLARTDKSVMSGIRAHLHSHMHSHLV